MPQRAPLTNGSAGSTKPNAYAQASTTSLQPRPRSGRGCQRRARVLNPPPGYNKMVEVCCTSGGDFTQRQAPAPTTQFAKTSPTGHSAGICTSDSVVGSMSDERTLIGGTRRWLVSRLRRWSPRLHRAQIIRSMRFSVRARRPSTRRRAASPRARSR